MQVVVGRQGFSWFILVTSQDVCFWGGVVKYSLVCTSLTKRLFGIMFNYRIRSIVFSVWPDMGSLVGGV